MKNAQLLPVSDDIRDRLVRMAGMHRMYGGPHIDIGAVVDNHVLVTATYDKGDLTDEEIHERMKDLFDGVEGMNLYYAILPGGKHVATIDGRHVFRLGEEPFLARVTESEAGTINVMGKAYEIEVIAGDPQDKAIKAMRAWVKSALHQGGITFLPGGLPETLEGARHIDDVLNELFDQSGLPPKLRTYKSLHLNGKLGQGAAINIVEENTNYRCIIVCVEKDA